MWAFIKKEFFHIFRDIRSMVILFGMPIAQVLLFGFANTTHIKDVNIAILDNSKDNITMELSNKLVSSGYFILNDNLKSNDQIEAAFKRGDIKEVVIFENDFAKKLKKEGKANVQLILDASEPNTANMISAYTSGIINTYSLELMKKSFKMPVSIITDTKMLYNPELKSVYMFVPGVITIILMLVSAMMTSISITREKEVGTMEAILVSPLRPIQIILGKVAPYVILSFINLIVILLLAKFVFAMPMYGSLILLLLESILFIVMALALGILITYHSIIGIYFSYRKYAIASTMGESYNAIKMVYYNTEKHYVKRSGDGLFLERNFDFIPYDYIFYCYECKEIQT